MLPQLKSLAKFAIVSITLLLCFFEMAASSSFQVGHTITKIRKAQFGNTKAIIGTAYDGSIIAMKYDGTVLWDNPLSGFMNRDIWCADINNDNNDEILLANADGSIYCLNSEGELLWDFKKNSAGMNAVCTISDGNDIYIACGGFDKNIYYLDNEGNEVKVIATSAFSNEKPWGSGHLPPKGVSSINHISTVKKSDGSEILVVNGTCNHMQIKGTLYLFEPLAEMPYRESSVQLGNSKTVGDLRAFDPDADGNENLYLGASGFRTDMNASVYNVNSGDFIEYDLPNLDFGYRVLQVDWIPDGNSYKYLFLFGNQMYVVNKDFTQNGLIELESTYSYWDISVDQEAQILFLASSQSGGNCIHAIDLTQSNWKEQYEKLQPTGSIEKILTNTETYRTLNKSFIKPDWEREQTPVYFLSEGLSTSTAKSVANDCMENYTSPIFLGNGWTSHAENWSRDDVPNSEFKNKRDGRRTYDWSQTQAVNFFTGLYNEKGAAFWGGHGNDPYMFSGETHRKILEFGKSQNKHTVLIYPELESHSTEFGQVMDHLFYPLAEDASKNNGKLFIRVKNIFWLSATHVPMWDDLVSGKYADVFIPSMEETTDKTMELSIAGRMGLWASSSVNSWGGRSVPDNVSMDRSRQFAHQRLPNHMLRQMVYAIASGAQYLDNLTPDSDYMSFLWELIAKGSLYVPQRNEILSFNPVHISMLPPNEEFLDEGTNVKWTTFYEEGETETNPMVFDRMKGHWPGAPVNEWDFSRYAAGVKDRRYHFIPPYNNGMVLLTPVQNGTYADKDAPRGKLVDNLHPFYKTIMSEYITDGHSYYSADGKQTYSANEHYTQIESEINQKAKLLPVTVSGEAGWVVAQTSPTHLRLTLVDGGYLNPSDKTVTVHFNNITPKNMKDVVDGKQFSIHGNSVLVDIPCGLFRFIDIELSEPLIKKKENDLIAIEAPATITKGWTGEVSVEYKAASEMDIVFKLVQNSSSETSITSSKTVESGEGAISANLTVPKGAEAGEYLWLVQMIEKGSNSSIPVDEIKKAVVVENEKRLADFFLPMEPQEPLVNSGTWGVNGGIWGGSNVSPRDTANGLEDAASKNHCYWDGGIVKGEDGKFHIYASRWGQDHPHSTGWKEDSKAIHAVADNIMGPYIDKGLCYPEWDGDNNEYYKGIGHNVVALKMHDGRYAVVSSEITPGNVFVSDSPDGPFEHLGQIEYDCNGFSCGLARYNFEPNHMSNVKMMLRPDGRYMIIPRTTAPMISENGILGPYKIMANAVYHDHPDIPQEKNEDPAFWYSGGLYHIMFNHWPTATMYHFTSEDGINDWTYHGIAIDKSEDQLFEYTNGLQNSWGLVERPTAYVDEETGHITHFMFSVLDTDSKGGDGANDNHASKIVIVPFDGEAFDCYIHNKIRADKGLPMQECTISEAVKVSGISLNTDKISININNSFTLKASVLPVNASNKSVVWNTENTNVATVEGGVVTGVSEGTAMITAKTVDGNYSASCMVTVQANDEEKIVSHTLPTSMVVGAENNFTITLDINEPQDIHFDLQNKIEWKTQSSHIVTVNSSGTVDISFIPPAGLSTSDTYQWIVYMTPVGANWEETIGKNIKLEVVLIGSIPQTIELKKGWNLISLSVEPDGCKEARPCISTVLPNAEIVKTFDGFYSSTQPEAFNSLHKIEAGKGYLVYNSIDETITITGVEVYNHTSQILNGWNLIGITEPISAQDYIDKTDATTVKDFEGVYENGNALNSLTELKAGKAYFIKK